MYFIVEKLVIGPNDLMIDTWQRVFCASKRDNAEFYAKILEDRGYKVRVREVNDGR